MTWKRYLRHYLDNGHVKAKYPQVNHVCMCTHMGVVCGVKSITRVNNYSCLKRTYTRVHIITMEKKQWELWFVKV